MSKGNARQGGISFIGLHCQEVRGIQKHAADFLKVNNTTLRDTNNLREITKGACIIKRNFLSASHVQLRKLRAFSMQKGQRVSMIVLVFNKEKVRM